MGRGWLAAGMVLALASMAAAAESTCYGTTSAGALRDGCKLPAGGDNYSTYSALGGLAGRTWVHCAVRDVVVAAYGALAKEHPDTTYIYGETGASDGGRFPPHKTHQNGLSVDFMVPVVDGSGKSVPLPTGVTNNFGYDVEFDDRGRYGDLEIDFEAMARHIAAVRRAADASIVGIWRIIFDPKLQPRLRKTQSWPEIEDLQFSKKRSWVRHDEHYHIDFQLPCRPLDQL